MAEVRIRRAGIVRWRSLEGDHVIYQPATDEVMGLDAVGSLVWDLLEHEPTRPELTAALAERFDEPVERIVDDVAPLLDRLCDAGMIEPVDQERTDCW